MSISEALDLGPYWLALWFVENWGPFCLGTFLGIAFERGETRLGRLGYAFSLVLAGIGPYVLLLFFLPTIYYAFLAPPGLATLTVPEPLHNAFALFAIIEATCLLIAFLPGRLLTRRLRDAGIEKKWAYLAAVPYLGIPLYIGLIFFPPSQAKTATPEEPVPQT